MGLFPYINPPALYFSSNKNLIIAELHIGLGLLTQAGSIAESVFESCVRDLEVVAGKSNAKRLIINGDLKESIGVPRRQELELLRRFEKFVSELFDEVVLVKGNHDGLIERYVDFKVVSNYTFVEDKLVVNVQHGHSVKPSPNMLVLGHLHPSIVLPDGSRTFVWVFLRRKRPIKEELNSVILMPPFNRFVGGGTVDKADLSKKLGIALEEWDSKVIGVNGLFFGGLESFASEC